MRVRVRRPRGWKCHPLKTIEQDKEFWEWYDDSATLRRAYTKAKNKTEFIKKWMEEVRQK